jgi:hypothetical protein
MVAIDGLMSCDLGVLEAVCLLFGSEQLDILAQRALVALEFRRVEGRENVAEVVVRRRSIAERQEAAKKLDLLLAEPRDIDEGFRSGKHSEQAQQQHLFERIDHLAALPRIRKIRKTLQKNKRFAVRPKSRTRLHRVLRKSNQRITTDSALQPFVTNYFTRLP